MSNKTNDFMKVSNKQMGNDVEKLHICMRENLVYGFTLFLVAVPEFINQMWRER